METNRETGSSIRSRASRTSDGGLVERLHDDESGVAMTEYLIVFSLISFGATLALLATAAYVKAYRDFLIWWLGHPAV